MIGRLIDRLGVFLTKRLLTILSSDVHEDEFTSFLKSGLKDLCKQKGFYIPLTPDQAQCSLIVSLILHSSFSKEN